MNDIYQKLNTKNIDLEIKFLKKKNVSLEITNKGRVIVRAPKTLEKRELDRILEKRYQWIIEHVEKIRLENNLLIKRNYIEDEKYYYLGEIYILKYSDVERIDVINKCIYVKRKNIKESLKKLYIEYAFKYINKRMQFFKNLFADNYKELRIRDIKSCWGKCTYNNIITFNFRLIMFKKEIIDYVIIHELAHIKHKNHSKYFWSEVEKFEPNYKKLRQELKYSGKTMDL
ncbi:MAG: M48 family metallopeptidase [Sarcina sp.]